MTPNSPAQTSPRKLGFMIRSAIAGAIALLLGHSAQAANGTWNATPTSLNWEAAGVENNWNNTANTFPGAIGTTTNTDIATFLTSTITAVAINATVANSSPLNIGGINFGVSGSTPSAFTIGTTVGNSLLLSSGGTIQIVTGATGSVTETVNAPLVLQPVNATSAGTYSFTNNSASDILSFGGAITTGVTSSTETLTLNGTNTGANIITGTITSSAGTAAGGFNIAKGGTGSWTLGGNGTSTLSKGNINISGGTLNFGVLGDNANAPTLNITGNSGSGSGLQASGTSTFNMANGTLALSGISYTINFGGSGTQTFNQTGGTITSSGFSNFSANGGTSNLNLSGGALTSTNAAGIELAVRGTTNVILNGTAIVTAPVLNMRSSQLVQNSVNGTFDLGTGVGTGGTLVVNSIIPGTNSGTGSSTFNFNGGTLKNSTAGSPTFMTGLTNAFVKAGGAIINTNSFTDTIGQALLHDPSLGGTADGGLTLNDTAATKGTLILTGTSTYTGATTITAGTLQLGNGTTGNDGSIANTSGVTDNAALVYNLFGSQTAGYAITGSGTVTKSGAGTLDLAVANSYAGATTLNAGTLQVGNNAALGNSNSLVLGVSGGTISSDSTTARNLSTVNITETPTTAQSYTFGDATNTGALTFGTFTLNGDTTVTNPSAVTFGLVGSGKNFTKAGAGNLTLTGANNLTSTGSYTQSAGTTTLASGATLTTKLNVNGGTFDLNGQSISVNDLNGSGTVLSNGANAVLTDLITTGPDVFSGALTDGTGGTLGLTVNNATGGTKLTLSGSSNTFTGGLTLAGAGQTVVVTSATNGAGNSTAANAISLGGGTLSLTNNGAGGTTAGTIIYGSTANTNGYNVTTTGNATINVDSITAGVANKTIQLNNLSMGAQTLNVTGNTVGTGDSLSFVGTTTLNTTAGGATSTLNPTTANLTLGAITNAGTAGTNTLALSGTSTGNSINGVISQAAGGGLQISHTGAGTWTLGGNVSSTLAKGQLRTGSGGGTFNFATQASDTTSLTLNGQTSSGGNVGVFVLGGTFNMKGGTITTSSTGQGLVVQGTNTVFNQTGGLINTTNSDFIEFANSGNTTQNIIGGELRVTASGSARLELNVNGTSSTTNLSGTGLITTPTLVMLSDQTNNATSTATFNLGTFSTNGGVLGGTLATGAIRHGTSIGTGATTFNFDGGTLKATATNATFMNSNATAITSANVKNGGAIIDTNTFSIGISQALLNFAGATTDSLTKNGTGTLTLTGANTYSGGTIVNQGTLTIGTNGTLGATTGALTVNNNNTTAAGTATIVNLATAVDTVTGSLSGSISTPLSGTNTATINNGGSPRNFTVNQTTAGTYAGVIAGSGAFTLGSGSTNTLTLSGANTYSGKTSVQNGTLAFNTIQNAGSATGNSLGTPAVGANSIIDLGVAATSSGILKFNGTTNQTSNRIVNLLNSGTIDASGTSASLLTLNNATNAVTGTGFGLTLTGSGLGSISKIATGSGGTLAKSGNGTWTLTGANDYTGATSVTAGKLVVTGSIASSTTTVSGTGTISGSGTFGAVNVNSGGTLAPGDPTITNTGNLALNSGSTYAVVLNGPGTADSPRLTKAGTDYDQTNVTGTVSIDSSNSTLKLTVSGLVAISNYQASGSGPANTAAPNYFVINNDSTDLISGHFVTLTIGNQSAAIDYSVSNRFNGLNGLGDAYIGTQEYAISYTGDYATNSTLGGNDVVITAIPEPQTWAMMVGGLGMLVLLQRRRRANV